MSLATEVVDRGLGHGLWRGGCRGLAVLLLVAWAAPTAAAGTFAWANATGNWTDPNQWGGSAPSGTNPTDVLQFGGAAAYTSTNDFFVPFLVNQIQLNASVAEVITGSANGGTIRFSGDGAMITQDGGGAFSFGPGAANPLKIELAVPLVLGGNGNGLVTLDDVISGAAGMTKTGISTFRFGSSSNALASDNTFFGGLAIEDGTIRFNNNNVSGPSALRSNRITLGGAGASLRVGGSVNNALGELRTGEWSGSAGTIVAQNTAAANNDGLPILIQGLADATFSGTAINVPTGTGANGNFTVRGIGTQTLDGTLSLNGDVAVGRSAGLVFAGTASMGTAANGSVNLAGGTFTLDNRAVNNNNRLRDASATSTGLDVVGGGVFSLIGNAAGTTETIGRLQLGTSANARSGHAVINVTHTAGGAAATVLSLQSYSRDNTIIQRSTVDFTACDGSGAPLILGAAGANPRIVIGGTVNLTNGLLTSSNVADGRVGWATVNGSDFATYDVTPGQVSVKAVATVPLPGSTLSTANALLAGDGSIGGGGTFALNSLKIAPTAAGQVLSIDGSTILSTNAILLAGDHDYTIAAAPGGAAGGALGPRFIHVQRATLTLAAPQPAVSTDIVKAGGGTLVLAAANNGTGSLTINAGAVRSSIASLPTGGVQLRGGVLEITSGGTYAPLLGGLPGNINWTVTSQDRGSGGFAAIGAPLTVDLNNPGADNLTWEQTGFVNSGHALIFGSVHADQPVTFVDNIGLTQAGVGNDVNYSLREIRVVDNPAVSTDYARINGAISGVVRSDLVKTGNGTLELTGANTQNGGIVIADGALLLGNSLALGNAPYVLIGARGGSADAALLVSQASGGSVLVYRPLNIPSGSTGKAVLGNTSLTAGSAADVNVISDLTYGITGSTANRLVQFTVEPGTTVTFAGAVTPVGGYSGTMSFEKIGAGMVAFTGPLVHTGSITTSAGTLSINGPQTHGPGSSLEAQGGTTNLNSDGGENLAVHVAAAVNFGSSQHLGGLYVHAGGTAAVTSGGAKVLVTPDLAVDPSGALDVADNDLVVRATAGNRAAVLADVTARLTTGSNNLAWNGPGIRSAAAAGDASKLTAVGVMLNDNGSGGPFHAAFSGEVVDANAVLVKYTYYGDADLTGIVDGTDYALIDNGFNAALTGWFNGDFDYSGIVDGTDYALIDNAFNGQGPPLGGLSAVPEPSGWLLLALGAAALVLRRLIGAGRVRCA